MRVNRMRLFAALATSVLLSWGWTWPPKEQWLQVDFIGGAPDKVLKKNVVSELDIAIRSPADANLEVTSLTFDARMPEHRHGMVTKAKVSRVDKNRFAIAGVNLHMSGNWELVFRLQTADGARVLVVPYHVR